MQLVTFIKPNGIEDKISRLLQSNNVDELRAFSQTMEIAFKDLKNWAIASMGNYVCEWGNSICLQIPVEKVNELPNYLSKYEGTTGLEFRIGIGMVPEEAYKALCIAENSLENHVVMYSDEAEEQLDQDEWTELEKALPDTQYQGDHGIDLPQLGLDKEPEQPKQEGQPQELPKVKETPKMKVVQTLQQIKQMMPAIQALKEQNPEIYKALKSVIDRYVGNGPR